MFFELQGVSKAFGGLKAVNDVSFMVNPKEVVGVIGPNGAGKTTLFNLINGILKPDSGSVVFKDENISGCRPHAACNRGMARTFQIAQPFKDMTVLENAATAAFCRTSSVQEAFSIAEEAVALCGLSPRASVAAKNLTTIDQRRLEVAKAMATKPDLILLDEIMAGLTRTECETAMDLVRSILNAGVAILMVEHVMKAVVSLCNRIVVLKQGCKLAEGTPQEVMNNEEVIDAYLGKGGQHACSN